MVSVPSRYLETVRRHVYVTPKSYLELIALYKSLLTAKREELNANRQRLESGIDKIAQASQQVAELQVWFHTRCIRWCVTLGYRVIVPGWLPDDTAYEKQNTQITYEDTCFMWLVMHATVLNII